MKDNMQNLEVSSVELQEYEKPAVTDVVFNQLDAAVIQQESLIIDNGVDDNPLAFY